MEKLSKTFYVLTDYFYGWINFIKMYFYGKPPDYYLNNSKKGFAPVVFIHGFLARWGFMKPLGDKLARLGYPVYVIPELGQDLVSVEKGAKIVKAMIKRENLKGVVLVGHSKGGIIGKYLLVHENSDGRIAGLVALAAPFLGARFASLVRSARELGQRSDLLMDLLVKNGVNKKIVTIGPSFDETSLHKGDELVGAENVTVKATGHKQLLSSQETANEVVKAIEKLSKRSRIRE